MANNSGQSKANDTGDWSSNKEMNPAANSSITENGLLESNSQEGEQSWRTSDVNIQNSETGNKSVNPGRTPGKAEGVEDSEERGNQ
jgi:hypothetical protein